MKVKQRLSIMRSQLSIFALVRFAADMKIYPVFGELTDLGLNHFGSYSAYNGFNESNNEYRYFTTMYKERCDEYRRDFAQGKVTNGHPVRLEKENVENWYSKTFAERVDYIFLYLNSKIPHMGEYIKLKKEDLFSCFFG